MSLPVPARSDLAADVSAGPRLERRSEERGERKAPWWTALITPGWMIGAALLSVATDHAIGPLTSRLERLESRLSVVDQRLARIDARQDASLNDRIDLRRLLYAELRGQCVALSLAQITASSLPCEEARQDGRTLDMHARHLRADGEPNQ